MQNINVEINILSRVLLNIKFTYFNCNLDNAQRLQETVARIESLRGNRKIRMKGKHSKSIFSDTFF